MVSARFPFYCSQLLNCGGTREAGSGVSMLRRAMQPLQSMFDDNSPTQTNDGTNQLDHDTRAYLPYSFFNKIKGL